MSHLVDVCNRSALCNFVLLYNTRNIIFTTQVYVIRYYNLSFTFVSHAVICSIVWLRAQVGGQWQDRDGKVCVKFLKPVGARANNHRL